MRVEVQESDACGTVSLPAQTLKDAGMKIGQILELRVEGRRLVLQPGGESLDFLLSRMTLENQHELVLDGIEVSKEF